MARPPAAGVRVARTSALGGPNTKDVKQMLLDWCRAKTEPYEVSAGGADIYVTFTLILSKFWIYSFV